MIITKTPFRMSFFGGGTDMPEFFNQGRGAVISTTFDKYVYVTARHLPRFFDYASEIKYSKIERVTHVDEIEHPMIRNAMKMTDTNNTYISYDADLPGKTGLGTSSTFAVGLLNAFYRMKGITATAERLANDAIYLERTLCGEAGGWQDQIAAAFGGFNRIDFGDNRYTVTPLCVSAERKEKLNDNLLLFFTGFTRFSADIQTSTMASMPGKMTQLHQMLDLVDEAQDVLQNNQRNLDDFGRLLDKTWQLKRQIGRKVTKDSIDALYNKGMQAGALGGKLLGAGGGGFLVFYVPQEKQGAVRTALSELMGVPFKFENEGARVIYYAPDNVD